MLEGVRLAGMERRLAASARSFLHYSTLYAIVWLSGFCRYGTASRQFDSSEPRGSLRLDVAAEPTIPLE